MALTGELFGAALIPTAGVPPVLALMGYSISGIEAGQGGAGGAVLLYIAQTMSSFVSTVLFWQADFIACLRQVNGLRAAAAMPTERPAHVEGSTPPVSWPERGEIHFESLSVRYGEGAPVVLKDVSFTIRSGEKVGVVGRTGAGKSSLVAALFRLVEPCGGHIELDGVNCSNIGLTDLRRNIGIVTQDPVMFEGTLRSNIDPFDQFSDEEVWASLRIAHLEPFVLGLEQGLMSLIQSHGENFSQGQKQQLSLARAVLTRPKVLILDEVQLVLEFQFCFAFLLFQLFLHVVPPQI